MTQARDGCKVLTAIRQASKILAPTENLIYDLQQGADSPLQHHFTSRSRTT